MEGDGGRGNGNGRGNWEREKKYSHGVVVVLGRAVLMWLLVDEGGACGLMFVYALPLCLKDSGGRGGLEWHWGLWAGKSFKAKRGRMMRKG